MSRRVLHTANLAHGPYVHRATDLRLEGETEKMQASQKASYHGSFLDEKLGEQQRLVAQAPLQVSLLDSSIDDTLCHEQ